MDGFPNGSDIKWVRKKISQKDSKTSELSNWKDGLSLTEKRKAVVNSRRGVAGMESRIKAQF